MPDERSSSFARFVRPLLYAVASLIGLAVAARAAMSLAALMSFLQEIAGEDPVARVPPDPMPVSSTPLQPASTPSRSPAPLPAPVVAEPNHDDPRPSTSKPHYEQIAGSCSLGVRLSAVIFDAQQPHRSVATLRGAQPDSSRDYAVGMRVGDHVLAELLPNAARFARDGESCWLRMFGQRARDKIAVERANSRAQARAAKGKGGGPAALAGYPPLPALSAAEQAAAIETRADGEFIVDRALLGKALQRWEGVEATTQVGKAKRGKKGLKLDGLRANGLLEALGLRGGDVLHSANGRRVARIADLRRALVGLSGGQPVELDLERNGRRVELEYAAR